MGLEGEMGETAVAVDATVLEKGSKRVGGDLLKPAVDLNAPQKKILHSTPKVVSFKTAGEAENSDTEEEADNPPSPVIKDSVELPEFHPDLSDEDADEDDFVVYDESVEQAELTGRLSELSRRTTLESVEAASDRTGSGRLGKIELLLAQNIDECIDSDSESSLLGDKEVSDELAALQAEVEREVSNIGRRSLPRNAIEAASQANEASAKSTRFIGEQKNSSLSGGSPITLRNSVFGETQNGIFSDVPLLVGSPGLQFEGLVFCETVDSQGRPVVVINTSALPSKGSRNKALEYISQSLESVIAKGPYVLVFAAFSSSSLSKVSASWVVGAYRKLAKVFKKNVEHIVLVRPNRMLKGIVKLLSMVVKKKSRRKLKQVQFLSDIGSVTDGEVQLEHLSSRVLASLGRDGLSHGGNG